MCGQHGMQLCDSYRAQITAIFATAINHPIRSPASSANPHNHAPHGVSRHHGDSGPVILCTRESPHAFPHAHSHAHSHTTCTVRHAPSTTARAKLHTVPHGSVTAQPTSRRSISSKERAGGCRPPHPPQIYQDHTPPRPRFAGAGAGAAGAGAGRGGGGIWYLCGGCGGRQPPAPGTCTKQTDKFYSKTIDIFVYPI